MVNVNDAVNYPVELKHTGKPLFPFFVIGDNTNCMRNSKVLVKKNKTSDTNNSLAKHIEKLDDMRHDYQVETANLVTVMACHEVLNPQKPDTFLRRSE